MDVSLPPPFLGFLDLYATGNYYEIVHVQSDPIQRTFLDIVMYTNHTETLRWHLLLDMDHNISDKAPI